MAGKMIIFSAPSGAGKTTLVKHLLDGNFNLEFSISATSRPKREIETEGKDYYFLSVEEFKRRIKDDEFVEWEEVYKNRFYGTLKSEVERIWTKGNHVIFDVDVKGGISIKKLYGDRALAFFVEPPSIQELKERLVQRSLDSKEDISDRVEKAAYEMAFSHHFDRILINDNLEKAFLEAEEEVAKFLNS